MADTTTFSAAMKTRFLGPIRDQLSSNKILLFGLRSKDGDSDQGMPHGSRDFRGIVAEAEGIDFVGNEFRVPLHTSRNQGTGPRAQSATLPAPGNQGYQYISESLKFFYGLFNITGQLLKASESNEGAFKRALTAEMEGVTDDLKRHVNIQAFGAGNGVLASITTGATSATQAVSTTIYFQGGEYVDIYDSTLTTYRGSASVSVTAVNRTALTITLSSSVATTTNDVIVRASSDSTSGSPNNDKGQAINGLDNIVDSAGALHGLNPATAGQGFWASQEIAAAGAVVGDNLLRQLMDGIGFESGKDDDALLLTTRGIRNRYANTLTALKRFNDAQAVTLRGGFSALLFDNKPMVVDDHCQLGYVYALSPKDMMWIQMSDWEWMEEDGKVLKWESRLDRYVAVLFKYCNLGTYRRNAHGKITGAADDSK
jgi:hypothetical protein